MTPERCFFWQTAHNTYMHMLVHVAMWRVQPSLHAHTFACMWMRGQLHLASTCMRAAGPVAAVCV